MNYLLDNILSCGSIMASPSFEPDYRFHWVRDAAIVMKSVITLYEKNQDQKYMDIMEKYIDTELEHIRFHPAEPKFNLDKTPYTGDWGRPQNDGPAMRGIVCIKLLKYMSSKYSYSLLKIINSDLSYTIDELDQPCFDLWEEEFGYHLYTRMLQTKFLYSAFLNTRIKNSQPRLTSEVLSSAKQYLSHHFSEEGIFSSYDTHGRVLRKYDASFLLGLSHVDYDLPNINLDDARIQKYVSTLVRDFNENYEINKKMKIPFLGRYTNDKYFNGNPWLITTIALYQFWNKTNQEMKGFLLFLELLKNKKMDLPEQLDKETMENRSVERLTWNYAELITLMNQLDFCSLSFL